MEVDFSSGTDAALQSSAAGPVAVPTTQLLGFVVPGGPVRTDFVPAPSGDGLTTTKWTLTMTAPGGLPLPLSSVSDVVCFLLPNAPLPPTHGLLVYWQVKSPIGAAETGFELLGAITPTRPSGVFRTSWSGNEQILQMEQQQPSSLQVVLGVSMEPLDQVTNLSVDRWGVENRLFVAQKIATDLFRYMQSFDSGTDGSRTLTVPTNVFDRWIARFEARFRSDPNFFMKSED